MAISLKRPLAALSLAALAIFGVTACGNTATVDAPASTDASTQTSTESTETSGGNAAPSAAGQLTEDNFNQVVNDAMLAAKSVHLDMEMTMMGQTTTMTGNMVMDDDPSKLLMSIDMDAMGMSMKMLMADAKLYANMGELSQNKWVDLTDSTAAGDFEDSLTQSDPRAQMDALKDALTEFTVSDSLETVNGVEAYRYDLTVDTNKVLAASGDAAALEAAGSSLPESIKQVMWVTPDGLLVKVEQSMTLEVSGQTIDSLTTVNYSDWGKPVDITAPPADEVIPASQLGM